MSHAAQPLHWVILPRQTRTQESYERLLDAAEALLQDKRFEDVHVAEVARRAGTSVAAFYRRFTDKDALLKKSGAVLNRISQVAMRLSGMTQEAMVEAEEDLTPAQS